MKSENFPLELGVPTNAGGPAGGETDSTGKNKGNIPCSWTPLESGVPTNAGGPAGGETDSIGEHKGMKVEFWGGKNYVDHLMPKYVWEHLVPNEYMTNARGLAGHGKFGKSCFYYFRYRGNRWRPYF